MVSKTYQLSMAKIISAQADVKSAKLLSEVSEILNSKPAMQMRYLETLQSVGKTEGKKVIFLPFIC
jgi:erythrocyte band 7 integral membrane protein